MDTLRAGAPEKLNPTPLFSPTGEAILKSLSGWFFISGLAEKAAPWGERENLSVSTGLTATEAETEAFRAHKNSCNTTGDELARVVSRFTCSKYLFI